MAWRRPGAKPLSEPMMAIYYWRIYTSLGLNELKMLSGEIEVSLLTAELSSENNCDNEVARIMKTA